MGGATLLLFGLLKSWPISQFRIWGICALKFFVTEKITDVTFLRIRFKINIFWRLKLSLYGIWRLGMLLMALTILMPYFFEFLTVPDLTNKTNFIVRPY